MKGVQYFTKEYLDHCSNMTSAQILNFLEDFRKLHANPGELQQINLRVPKNTLKAFKAKARSEGVPYQSKIKELMQAWLWGRPS